MVTTYKMHDDYILYDNESGSLYVVDELTHLLILKKLGSEVDLSRFTFSDIKEAESEIEQLRVQGYLFAPSANIKISSYSKEIKALCLHVCHDCNLRCKYCFADEGKYHGQAEYMDLETGKKAIDFLIKNSGKRKNLEVDFFGGEPLMNFDVVKKLVDYATIQAKEFDKSFKFTLTTNAILLNQATADYLNENMDNVVLSLDGRKLVHDSVRPTINNKGSFDTALKNSLEFSKKRGSKSYYVRGTFTAKNLDFLEDVLFLNDCGFDQISIEPVVLKENHALALKNEHVDYVNNNYEQLAKEYIIRRKDSKTWFNFFHFYIDMQNSPCLHKRLKGCGAGNEYLAVSPKGDIYPCHQFVGNEKYKMGNVYGQQIDEDIKKVFASSNLLSKSACKDCFAKYHCSGGCASNNISFMGDIDTPYDVSCLLMKKRFQCALYVFAKENL